MKSPIKAVIFDLDGLLVDSEPLWYEGRRIILEQFGVKYLPEDKKKVMGTDYREGVQMIIGDYSLPITVEEFTNQEKELLDRLYSEKLKFMPGAEEFLERVEEANILKAIATSSSRNRLNLSNRLLGLKEFDESVTGDEVEKGKPSPDIYLKAAEKLDVDPKNCVAIEDAPRGVQSAKAAGMVTVVVFDSRYTQESDFVGEFAPDLLVNSLEDLTIEKIKRLFR